MKKPHQTLEELEHKVWGEPEHTSGLVATCHELRKKPINQFTVENLRIMIGQGIGLHYLVPVALDVLEKRPLASGDFYHGDLLSALLTSSEAYWVERQHIIPRMLSICTDATNRMDRRFREDNDEIAERLDEMIEKFRETWEASKKK